MTVRIPSQLQKKLSRGKNSQNTENNDIKRTDKKVTRPANSEPVIETGSKLQLWQKSRRIMWRVRTLKLILKRRIISIRRFKSRVKMRNTKRRMTTDNPFQLTNYPD